MFDLSSIDTIDKAIAYRKAIVDSYVEKGSILDKFNNWCERTIKPFQNYFVATIKNEYEHFRKSHDTQFEYLKYKFKSGDMFFKPVYEENSFNEQKKLLDDIKNEYNNYFDTKIENKWNLKNEQMNVELNKQAENLIKNISKNTWDEIEIKVDNSNRMALADIMTTMQQNPKFDYGNKTQFENSYVLDKGEGSVKLRISHNDFKQVYTDMFEKGSFTDSKFNNIKLAFLDSNINNNEIIKNSVKFSQINNMGEKQAIINNDMADKLVKKNQTSMSRGM